MNAEPGLPSKAMTVLHQNDGCEALNLAKGLELEHGVSSVLGLDWICVGLVLGLHWICIGLVLGSLVDCWFLTGFFLFSFWFD